MITALICMYVLAILVSAQMITTTRNPAKAFAYLLVILILPPVGILLYYTVGQNYRKRRLFRHFSIIEQVMIEPSVHTLFQQSGQAFARYMHANPNLSGVVKLLVSDSFSPLTEGNAVQILHNGEEKFPALLADLQQAKHHIHLEYYIFEESGIGAEIAEILMQKASEGVEVRLLYDDFGSAGLSRAFEQKLKDSGVQIVPFYKIYVLLFSHRLNYRNHRKMVIVDGKVAYTGGINVSDKYRNIKSATSTYWRDTHVRLEGPSVQVLQYIFINTWNFASDTSVPLSESVYFPKHKMPHGTLVQVAASGPDSARASIMLAYLTAITNAQHEVLITSPYFIPNETLLDALKTAALRGVDVRILVPEKADSHFVNTAAASYFEELLDAGVRIYRYTRGFVHAKTIVIDSDLAVIGSANFDYRSFELNFEVSAFIYDAPVTTQLKQHFYDDLHDATEVLPEQWKNRSSFQKGREGFARMFSPLL